MTSEWVGKLPSYHGQRVMRRCCMGSEDDISSTQVRARAPRSSPIYPAYLWVDLDGRSSAYKYGVPMSQGISRNEMVYTSSITLRPTPAIARCIARDGPGAHEIIRSTPTPSLLDPSPLSTQPASRTPLACPHLPSIRVALTASLSGSPLSFALPIALPNSSTTSPNTLTSSSGPIPDASLAPRWKPIMLASK